MIWKKRINKTVCKGDLAGIVFIYFDYFFKERFWQVFLPYKVTLNFGAKYLNVKENEFDRIHEDIMNWAMESITKGKARISFTLDQSVEHTLFGHQRLEVQAKFQNKGTAALFKLRFHELMND